MMSLLATSLPERYLSEIAKVRGVGAHTLLNKLRDQQSRLENLELANASLLEKMQGMEYHLVRLVSAHQSIRVPLIFENDVVFPVLIEEWLVCEGQYFDNSQPVCRTNRGVFGWSLTGILERVLTRAGEQVVNAGDAIGSVIVLQR